MKRKFPLPTNAPEFEPPTQSKLILGIGAMFCAIRKYAPETLQLGMISVYPIKSIILISFAELDELEELDRLSDDEFLIGVHTDELFAAPETEGELHYDISAAEKVRADARRDSIAQAMWRDYVQTLEERQRMV